MAKNNLQVEVNEATADETRTITITITGAAEDFLLADLLAQRKAIQSCSACLKTAALEATRGYLESAEEVISGVKSEQKKDAAATSDGNGKRGRKSKDDLPENGIPPASVRPKTVSGAPASPALSGD